MANYDLTYEGSEVQKILDTGDELQTAGYIFRGEATPSTVPGTPTERVAYVGGPGTYNNFGTQVVVQSGSIVLFKYDGSSWSSQVFNISSNGYIYAGIAGPTTVPVTGNVFYLAITAGTYTNFDSLTLTSGLNILKFNGSAWAQEQIYAFETYPTQGSNGIASSGGTDTVIRSLTDMYTCSTAAATAAKTISTSYYVLRTGGCIKVTFTNANTADDATLQIGSADAKPLFFNGARASSTNSWNAGQTLEIFYDGTNYQAHVIPVVDDIPTKGSRNFVESGGVYPSAAESNYLFQRNKYNIFSLINIDPEKLSKIDYILAIRIYIPNDYASIDLQTELLGLYSPENKFYLRLVRKDNKVVVGSYFSINKESGVKKYSVVKNDIILEITIDWTLCTSDKYMLTSYIDVAPAGITSENQDFYEEGVCLYNMTPLMKFTKLDYLQKLSISVPEQLSSHEYSIAFLGLYTSESAFYIGIYDKTDSNHVTYMTKVYDTVPQSGLEEIKMSSNTGYVFTALVDWSKCDGSKFINPSVDSVKLRAISQDFSTDNFEIFSKKGTNGIYELPNGNLIHIENSAILIGEYYLNTTLTLRQGQYLRGIGATVHCGDNAKILMDRDCVIEGINFVGYWNPERTEQGSGYTPLISITDLENNDSDALWGANHTVNDAFINTVYSSDNNQRILNCTFSGFKRCTVVLKSQGAQRSGEKAILTGCTFKDCWMGVAVIACEFAILSDNHFFRNIIANYLGSGNISKCGNVIYCCDVGVYYPDTANNAHGESSGIEIAHCGVAGLYIKKIQYYCGELYSGCQIVDAPVIAENSGSLSICGCILDTFVSISNGQHNAIINNVVGVSYKRGNPLYSMPNDSIIRDNIPLGNATDSEINPV